MNKNENTVTAPAVETPETKQVVASVPKVKGRAGRPALVCKFLDKYMTKQYTRLSLADIQCAANLMNQWVAVKSGTAPVESARYVAPPKAVKVAKAVAEVTTPPVS